MTDRHASAREGRAFKSRHGMRSSGDSLKRTLLPLIVKAARKRKRGRRERGK